MKFPESLPEKPESPIDKIIQSFSKLKDELLTPDFLAELKKKTPQEITHYKIDLREDFLELNMYFSSIKTENEDEKNKIVTIMAPIFDAIDRGDADPIMESFLSNLLPPRSFIQDYYN